MKRVVSVSGGKTSAYIAANYEHDKRVFALVRTSDVKCKFKDRFLAKRVEDRIQNDFIGTLEDDTIIHTIFDLEQCLGKRIDWVTGVTFEEVVKSDYLPNRQNRFCTTELKIRPIFDWWKKEFLFEPVLMDIGYRYTERSRKKTMIEKLNKNGLSEFKGVNGFYIKGRWKGHNKFSNIEWRKPNFPLIDDCVFKDEIENFWELKNVRFAEFNNCVGCPNRNPSLLKYQSKLNKDKFQWFVDMEESKTGFWKKEISYKKILELPESLTFGKYGTCESGFCGV